MCILRNVAVWNGTVYLLHNSGAEADTLPRLRLTAWGPAETTFSVTSFFKSGEST